jgi:hypothetical protein
LKEFALETDQDFYSLLTLQQPNFEAQGESLWQEFYNQRAESELLRLGISV